MLCRDTTAWSLRYGPGPTVWRSRGVSGGNALTFWRAYDLGVVQLSLQPTPPFSAARDLILRAGGGSSSLNSDCAVAFGQQRISPGPHLELGLSSLRVGDRWTPLSTRALYHLDQQNAEIAPSRRRLVDWHAAFAWTITRHLRASSAAGSHSPACVFRSLFLRTTGPLPPQILVPSTKKCRGESHRTRARAGP